MPHQRMHHLFAILMEFVQGLAHRRNEEDPAAMRDAQNKPNMRGCASHMVQTQNNSATTMRDAQSRL
jgi:hypothetical protein